MTTKKQLKRIINGLLTKDCDLCFNQHKDSCPNSKFCRGTKSKPCFQPKHELYREYSDIEKIYSVIEYQADLESITESDVNTLINFINEVGDIFVYDENDYSSTVRELSEFMNLCDKYGIEWRE